MENNNKKVSWFVILLYVYLIGFVVSLLFLPPPFKKVTRRNAPEKTCFSNQRVIQGAVDMYNMDSEIMMKDFDINLLLKGNYLKEIPEKPDKKCFYVGYNLDNDGYIYCTYHGDVERKIKGTYDGEKVNFEDYFKSRREILAEAIVWPLILFFNILHSIH